MSQNAMDILDHASSVIFKISMIVFIAANAYENHLTCGELKRKEQEARDLEELIQLLLESSEERKEDDGQRGAGRNQPCAGEPPGRTPSIVAACPQNHVRLHARVYARDCCWVSTCVKKGLRERVLVRGRDRHSKE